MPLARLGLTARYFPEFFGLGEKSSPRWDTTTAICESIRQEFAAHGAPVIFIFLPTPYQVEQKIFETYLKSFRIRPDSVDLQQPNTLLGTRFRDASLTVLDPLEEMRQKSNQGMQMYGVVDFHLNANGHEAVTALLLPAVQAALKR